MRRRGVENACLDCLRARRRMVELLLAEGEEGPRRERSVLLDRIRRAEKVVDELMIRVEALAEGALRSKYTAHGEGRGLKGRWKYSRRQHWRRVAAG